jgi:hypothetical protein
MTSRAHRILIRLWADGRRAFNRLHDETRGSWPLMLALVESRTQEWEARLAEHEPDRENGVGHGDSAGSGTGYV